MAKYLIHTCNNRRWYIDKYLVPSMIDSGIKEEDITIYQDTNCDGNLVSFIKSCKMIVNKYGTDTNVWHLQDDVLISTKFKMITELLSVEKIIACGFSCVYDEGVKPGTCKAKNEFWWSFPCIMIPNKVASDFTNWVDTYVWNDSQYAHYVNAKKYDDLIFKIFVQNYYPEYDVINIAPNIVEHVDYLLGGSVVNAKRGNANVKSIYWNEENLVNDLITKLKKNGDLK